MREQLTPPRRPGGSTCAVRPVRWPRWMPTPAAAAPAPCCCCPATPAPRRTSRRSWTRWRQRVSRPGRRSARAIRVPRSGRGDRLRAVALGAGALRSSRTLARPGRWCCSAIPSAAWSPAAPSWPARRIITRRRSDPAVLRAGGLQPGQRYDALRAGEPHHARARQGSGLRQHGGRRPGGPQDRPAGSRRTAPAPFPASSQAGLLGMGAALQTEPDRVDELHRVLSAAGTPVAVIAGRNDDAWPLPDQAGHGGPTGHRTGDRRRTPRTPPPWRTRPGCWPSCCRCCAGGPLGPH